MKKFFAEFKTFITRGNVMDMAVGVIVGGAFTAIVNGLSNYILKPIINWLLALIFGANSLSEVFTMLQPVYDAEGNLDLTNSIYINWGEFINAIINFLLIALVLFTIVKIFNRFRELKGELGDHIEKKTLNRAEKKELKAAGVNIKDKAAVETYFANKEAAEKAAAEEATRLQKENNPTAEELLKQILAELKNK